MTAYAWPIGGPKYATRYHAHTGHRSRHRHPLPLRCFADDGARPMRLLSMPTTASAGRVGRGNGKKTRRRYTMSSWRFQLSSTDLASFFKFPRILSPTLKIDPTTTQTNLQRTTPITPRLPTHSLRVGVVPANLEPSERSLHARGSLSTGQGCLARESRADRLLPLDVVAVAGQLRAVGPELHDGLLAVAREEAPEVCVWVKGWVIN